jgi:protocatechuate 3,4-dioxygenase beta subunit
VDHEGAIHLVQQGGLPAKVKQLLESAGQEQVPAISLEPEPPNFPRELWDAWREMVHDAERPARIVGTVTDQDGPLAGAQVEGTLQLELAGRATFATHSFAYRDEAFRGTTGEDGKFAIGELCKGVYALRFELPGRAAVIKRVVLAPGEKELVVDADLTQRDGIHGRVVDVAGNPIDGAKVTIRHRHSKPDDMSFTCTYNADPSVTDADGRFRFENLEIGAYTLDIAHPDFLDEVLEHVPAGEANSVVKLRKRSDNSK